MFGYLEKQNGTALLLGSHFFMECLNAFAVPDRECSRLMNGILESALSP